jgi:hypothetical protein
MDHAFAEISIEESLRRVEAADRHGQEELGDDRGCCGRYIPPATIRALAGASAPVRWVRRVCRGIPVAGVSCMISGYQVGQISLDDLASGFRNRTWARSCVTGPQNWPGPRCGRRL